ncbi:uncharacterized protein DSM5745_03124 [Aspergillus mulundensis]|uniref:BHLH domain-containing protein n=1 Tax=Aspergillus mulundensis TaxID=1810919 RepID=A0A3D8SJN0_9EURO|nr:hypothetical protein DSM5745_03124 [Aspergillus mulundensis]RDW86482.1 hypothetical protein DSM5745_03124 [Aspergillus mulundensis]
MNRNQNQNQNQPPQTPIPPELAASRDDFELFRRLLRVARLLTADNSDNLLNQSTQRPASLASRFDPQSVPCDGSLVGLLHPALRGNITGSPGGRPTGGGSSHRDVQCDEDGYSPSVNNEGQEDDEEEDDYASSPRTLKRKRPSSPQNRTRRLRPRQPASPAPAQRQPPSGQEQEAEQEQEQDQGRPHAAVEKRYRAMVNAKIQHLHAAIPASNTFSLDPEEQGETSEKTPTKSVVLDRAIQYLSQLVSAYEQYENEGNALRARLWAETAVDDGSNPIPVICRCVSGGAPGTKWPFKSTPLPSVPKVFSDGQGAVWIPGLGARKELILPSTSIKWALGQPSRVLNHRAGLLDVDFPKYLLGDDFFLNDPWHAHLVKSELVPELDHVCEVMTVELEAAFNDSFGADTKDWREIDILDTMRKIVGRASCRFIVGELLWMLYVVLILYRGSSISILVLGPLIRRRAQARFDKLAAMIEAEYHACLDSLQPNQTSQPNDFFQMILRYAQRERPHELNLYAMTRRLFLANLGSIHRTAFLTTNVLLNIINSNTKHSTIAMLREEVAHVLTDDGLERTDMSSWNRPRTNKLFRAESVGRETMRRHSLDNRSAICKDLADGIVTGDRTPFPGARGYRSSDIPRRSMRVCTRMRSDSIRSGSRDRMKLLKRRRPMREPRGTHGRKQV